jgi:hypothetical protein
VAQKPKKRGSKQRWLTADEQLARAKAVRGSAFEKFILANQDHSLLRPEEHNGDGIGYPLWLRVYYRKQHPDEPLAPAGPAGDYPEVLNRIQEWMQLNQELLPNPSAWLDVAKRTPKGGHRGD